MSNPPSRPLVGVIAKLFNVEQKEVPVVCSGLLMPIKIASIVKRTTLIKRMAVVAFAATTLTGLSHAAPLESNAPQPSKQLTMQSTGNTIFITGGGSGIGRELALRFNHLGNTVIVSGRRIAPLQETIAGRKNMHAIELDVDNPDEINAVAQRVVAEYPKINILINNAGIMRYEDLSRKSDLHDAQAQMTTNLLGPIRLTNALVDHLKARPNAAIVNVSSGLAFVPRADAAVYSATKAAIHSYTVSLREQLKDRVKVVELIPPALRTELTPGQSGREGYMPLDQFIDEVMEQFLQQPTPNEIVVERARVQRLAEREGRFDQVFDRINASAAQQRR